MLLLQLFDARGDGTMDIARLREIFAAYGYSDLSAEEVELLKKVT